MRTDWEDELMVEPVCNDTEEYSKSESGEPENKGMDVETEILKSGQ